MVGDIVSGVTIAILQIPQGMSYAILAGVQPVTGIYTAVFPVLVYVLLGTMHQVSMGTFAVVSIMVAQPVQQWGSSTNTTVEFSSMEVATSVTLCVGIIQLLLGIIGCGCLTSLLTDVIISAFNVGASYQVLTSQVGYILGLDIPVTSGVGRLVRTYYHVIWNITETNLVTLSISVTCLLLLISYDQFLAAKLKTKIPYPLPTHLILMMVFTALSSIYNLGPTHHLKVVSDLGKIPTGLPAPTIPPMHLISLVFLDSIPIAVVAFVISHGMGCMFAQKNKYQVFPSQELIAEGVSNMFGSLFSCITMCGAFSRSLVQEACGGRSMLTAFFSTFPLVAVLLYLGPYFQQLPVAVLASIIVSSLVGMFLKVMPTSILFMIT